MRLLRYYIEADRIPTPSKEVAVKSKSFLAILIMVSSCTAWPNMRDQLTASDDRPAAVSTPAATANAEGRTASEPTPALPFYGIQYVPLSELPQVRALGFDMVLTDFAYDADPAEWVTYLDTAWSLGMRVIPWLWPEGWKLNRQTGVWTIDATARRFLETVAGHPATFAVYALHEPYWMECDTCGYTTAEQQALYRAIKQIAPVPIYSEINGIAFWAEATPEKAIAPGVCDYCQTAFYPFINDGRYLRDELIALIQREIATLQRLAPESRLIWTMPAFEYHEDALRMPTSAEMWDYARLVYGRAEISGAWWYMWRWDNDLYSSYLALHPTLHPTVRKIADEIVAPRRGSRATSVFLPLVVHRRPLPQHARWQIQYTGEIQTDLEVDVFNLDLFDAPSEAIATLHRKGVFVMCYFSAGSYESWRPDAPAFPAEVLGKDMQGWHGEKWLDIRRIDLLAPIMEARLDLAVRKGCDGVDPDNVNGYTNDTGFPLTADDQRRYNLFLAHAAHRRGLLVGLKNDLEQVSELVGHFDWIINEECFSFGECERLLPFVQAGKPVFVIEYELEPSDFCRQALQMGFNALRKHWALDAYRVDCRE
ncbi:MAG: endo alpha-1,4 polygalactosaminidase [Anaerolineae bacterium]|nr:endo alpha-1,4 polygalactosaminidase [Anaerolineae bacterium]